MESSLLHSVVNQRSQDWELGTDSQARTATYVCMWPREAPRGQAQGLC